MADAAAEGAQAFGALSDAVRKNAAFNALAKIYGPGGGAVQEFQSKQAQEAAQTGLTTATTASTSATAAKTTQETGYASEDHARIAHFRALTALTDSVDPKTGSVDPDVFDREVGANAADLGIDSPDKLAAIKASVTAPGGAAHLDTVRQALLGPTKVTGAPVVAQDADGNSVLINKDQYGNEVQTKLAPGVKPVAQQREDTGQQNADTALGRLDVSKLSQKEKAAYDLIKGKIAQQNANTSAGGLNLRTNNSVFGQSSSAAPAGSAGAPAGPAGGANVANPQTPGPVTGAPGTVAPLFNSLPPKGKQAAIGQAQQLVNQKTNLDNVNTILDQVDKQISPWTAGAGSTLKMLPGGVQKDLQANLATLKAQGLTSWIQSLKNAQGQTGVGRVLQSEANAAMNLYGNMEQDQSAKQLAFHAQLFRKAVNNLHATARAGFKTMYGSDPEGVIGLSNPAPAAAAAPKGGKLSDTDLLKQYGVK
jgi:hypothetical protein